jgi:NAD(P)-dependent dehydrogenase (short-subunit alcohol dehydrogenase family)
LNALVEKIGAAGSKAIVLPGDIAEEKVADGVVAATLKHFGRLDILVNSAGVIQSGGVENADTARWRQVIDINLMANLYTCKAAIGPMRSRGGGDIINISSTAGRRAAGAVFGPYSTSKFRLTAMTEGRRSEAMASVSASSSRAPPRRKSRTALPMPPTGRLSASTSPRTVR